MPSKEERRKSIIKASLKIFAKSGFHKAKMQDIANEAGIGKGTLYEYFDSKKNLFQEMIKFCINEYKDSLSKALSERESVNEKLETFLVFHSKFLKDHIDMAQSAMVNSSTMSEEMKNFIFKGKHEIFNVVKNIIIEGKKSGELKKDLDEEIATLAIIGTINQYCGKKIFHERANLEKIDPTPPIKILLNGLK
ncbi:MAG: TetR/AcrR family transcriptional regulator [Firmicutes bacterium]|nr:TetR/AcrR family transcriptional regulator [Bacillota bacterium]